MINISRGAFLNLQGGRIMIDGNSISATAVEADGTVSTQTAYPVQLAQHPLITPLNVEVRNASVPGQDTNSMISKGPSQIDPYLIPGRSVLIAWEITNQLFNNVGGENAYNKFAQYCRARKAVGWKIIVITALARNRKPSSGSITEYNVQLNVANDLIKANWREFADQIVDVRQIPQLDPITATYMPDGTHPNALGLSFFVEALAPIVRRVPRN